jgi:hypothetical protein
MWCIYCRQDVPARPSGEKQSLCCPRCGGILCAEPDTVVDAVSSSETAVNSASITDRHVSSAFDDWETDEQLRHIERVLQSVKSHGRSVDVVTQHEPARHDVPHAGPPTWHMPQAGQHHRPKPKLAFGSVLSGVLPWSLFLLGTAGFLGGATLLGWSTLSGRQELWNLGLPATLIGQLALLTGLVLQTQRLWRHSRAAVAKLDNVDEQLHELKSTATLWSASHGPASSQFYSHLAGGAGSQLLLSDLKSQIDLLAMKLSQDER